MKLTIDAQLKNFARKTSRANSKAQTSKLEKGDLGF
jgi:hypothetical protein